jgi:YD repeat-containing protein
MSDDSNEKKKPDPQESNEQQQQQPAEQSIASVDQATALRDRDNLQADNVLTEVRQQEEQRQRELEQSLQGLPPGTAALLSGWGSMARQLASSLDLLGPDGKPRQPGDRAEGRRPRERGDSLVAGQAPGQGPPSEQMIRDFRALIARGMDYPAERHSMARAERKLQENSKDMPEAQKTAYNAIGAALVRGDSNALEAALKQHGADPTKPEFKAAIEALNKDLAGSGLSLDANGRPVAGPGDDASKALRDTARAMRRLGESDAAGSDRDDKGVRIIRNAEGKEIGREEEKFDAQKNTRYTERQIGIDGYAVTQKMYPDGSVHTTINSKAGGEDKRPFHEAVYRPGPPPSFEAKKDGKVVEGIKPDDSFLRSQDGKEAISASGQRQFTVTDDPKKDKVTEFPPNDPQGRSRETTFRAGANNGVERETVMRDGTIEREGRDSRGQYKSRTWNDTGNRQLTQAMYNDGGVVTTDGAGKQIGTDRQPVALGTSKDENGRDVTLMSDGTTVTKLADGKTETRFPPNNRDGKLSQVRDDAAGTTTTIFNNRRETSFEKGDLARKVEYADVSNGVGEERHYRRENGVTRERDIYKDGKAVSTEAYGRDQRGNFQSFPMTDAQGNKLEQRVYGNGTVVTQFDESKKTPGTLSEHYGQVIQEPGKPPVGVRWENMKTQPPKTEAISADELKKPLATMRGADGQERALQADGSQVRQTAEGKETTFRDGRVELEYKEPKNAKDAGVPNEAAESTAKVTKKVSYPENDPQGRTQRFEFAPGTRGAQTSETHIKGADGKPAQTLREFDGLKDKDGRTFERETNGKITETRFADGRFVLKPDNGDPSSGRTREITLKNGQKASIDVDDATGKVVGVRMNDGPRAGQQYNFNYERGQLTGITMPDGRQVQAGPDGKFDAAAMRQLGFNLDEKAAKDGKFNLRVTEQGDIAADNGKGITQYQRLDGSRQTYDKNTYSRLIETADGQSRQQFWDGYGWREASKTNPPRMEGDRLIVTFDDNLQGRPKSMERNLANDTLKVNFADNSSYLADWKGQQQTFTDKNGKKTELFNTGEIANNGSPIWRRGSCEQNGDVSFNTQNTSDADRERMRRGEIPFKTQVDKNTGEVTSLYANGARVLSDGQGRVKSVRYQNGQGYDFERNADGRLTRVKAPDGTVYERRGDQHTTAEGNKGDRWTMTAGNPPREVPPGFAGDFTVKADGTVERRSVYGSMQVSESNGRTTSYDRQGQPTRITEANGQTWTSDKPADANGKRTWRLQGNDKVEFTGVHKMQPDGTVAFETDKGVKRRNDDKSTSTFNGSGIEVERKYDNGAALTRDSKTGLPTQIRDMEGNVRDFTWGKNAQGQPVVDSVKLTKPDGTSSVVEQRDSKGVLREIKDANAREENDRFGGAVEYGGDGSRSVTQPGADGKPSTTVKRNLDGSEYRYEGDKFAGATIRKADGQLIEANAQGQAVSIKEKIPGTNEYRTVAQAPAEGGPMMQLGADGRPTGRRVVMTDNGYAVSKPTGGFESRRPDGTVEHLDGNGRFEYSTDKDGKRLRVADSRGGEANFEYKDGKLEKITYRAPDREQVAVVRPDSGGLLTPTFSDGRMDTYNRDGQLLARDFTDGSQIKFDPQSGYPTSTKDVYGTTRTFEAAGQWPPASVKVQRQGEAPTEEKLDGNKVLRDSTGARVQYDANTGTRSSERTEPGKPRVLVEERLDGTRFEKVGDGPATATNHYAAERRREEQSRGREADVRPPVRQDLDQAMEISERAMRERPEIPAEKRGSTEVNNATGDGATLPRQREALRAHAETLPEPQKSDLLRNMEKFEARARQENMTEAQIAKVYFQANRLLEANPANIGNGLDKADFARVAQGLIHGAATPGETNQGFHNSCNVSVVREAMLTKQPWVAGQAAADAMLSKDGVYTAPDGNKIRLDAESMRGDREARVSSQDQAHADAAGHRNQLGQVLDHVLSNYAHQSLFKQLNNPKLDKDYVVAEAFYKQTRPVAGRRDTGERFTWPGDRTQIHTGVSMDQIADVTNAFLGRNTVITNRLVDTKGERSIGMNSQETMQRALDGGLSQGPMSLLVFDGHPAIQDGKRSGGPHVVSVTDTKKIGDQTYYRISDQAGTAGDKWLSARDLYAASLPPEKRDGKFTYGPLQDKVYVDKKNDLGEVVRGADGKPEVVEVTPGASPSAPPPGTRTAFWRPWRSDVLAAGAVDSSLVAGEAPVRALAPDFMPPADTRSSADRAKEVFGDKTPGADSNNEHAKAYFAAKSNEDRQKALESLARQASTGDAAALKTLNDLQTVDAALQLKHAETGVGSRAEDARTQAVMRLTALGANDFLRNWAGNDKSRTELLERSSRAVEYIGNSTDTRQSEATVAEARAEFLRHSSTAEGRQEALNRIDQMQAREVLNNGTLNQDLRRQREELQALSEAMTKGTLTPEQQASLHALKQDRPDIAYRLNPAEIPQLRKEIEDSGDATRLQAFDKAIERAQADVMRETQQISQAEANYLERGATAEKRAESLAQLQALRDSSFGPTQERLTKTIADLKGLDVGLKLEETTRDRAADPAQVTQALEALRAAGTATPPNAMAQQLLAKVGDQKEVDRLIAGLKAEDRASREAAVQEIQQRLRPTTDSITGQKRVDQVMKGLSAESAPIDLARAYEKLDTEMRAGNSHAEKQASWTAAATVAASLREAKTAPEVQAAFERLAGLSLNGNEHARSAINSMVTGGGEQGALKVDLKGFTPEQQAALTAAAADVMRIQTEALGGQVDKQTKDALTAGLARAKEAGNVEAQRHLQAAIDSIPQQKPDVEPRTVTAPDGIVTKYDGKGEVAEVTRPNGPNVKVERQDGVIKSISASNGVSYDRNNDGTYTLRGSNPPQVVSGVPYVNPNGDFGFRRPDGRSFERRADHTLVTQGDRTMRINDNGSTQVLDKAGQVVASEDARGGVRTVERVGEPPKVMSATIGDRTWNRVEGNLWRSNDGRETRGEFDIDKDGNFTHVNAESKLETVFKTDGSTIMRNSEGDKRVLRTETSDGRATDYYYSNDGKLIGMKMPDGSTRTRMPDVAGQPERWAKEGTSEVRAESRSIDANGNLKIKGADGKERVTNSDGWTSGTDAQGKPTLTKEFEDRSSITKNAQGQIVETRSANGGIRKFGYDASGQLNSVAYGDKTWTLGADGKTWSKQGANPPESWQGTISLTADGGVLESQLKDGALHQTLRKTDNSVVNLVNGQATNVLRDNGSGLAVLGRDAQGKPNKIAYPNDKGEYLSTENGTDWQRYGADGKPVPGAKPEKFNIDLQPDGTMVKKTLDNNKTAIVRTDRSSAFFHADGRKDFERKTDGTFVTYKYDGENKPTGTLESKGGVYVHRDTLGRVTEVETANGKRKFEYNDQNLIVGFEENGKTYKLKQGTQDTYVNTQKDNDLVVALMSVRQDGVLQTIGRDGTQTFHNTDGTMLRQLRDGSIMKHDDQGRLTETIGPNGYRRRYGYGLDSDPLGRRGGLKSVTFGDGEGARTWTTSNGFNWTDNKGVGRETFFSVNQQTGELRDATVHGDVWMYGRDGASSKPAGLQRDVVSPVNVVAGDRNWYTRKSTLQKTIVNQFAGSSAEDMFIMGYRYDKNDPDRLRRELVSEVGGEDFFRGVHVNGLFKRRDGQYDNDAVQLMVNRAEQQEYWWSRDRSMGEIRRDDMLLLGSASEAKRVGIDSSLRSMYGTSLEQHVQAGGNRLGDIQGDEFYRRSMELFAAKGRDKRSIDEQTGLMDLALRSAPGNRLDNFMIASNQAVATDEARAAFKTNGGASRITEAFTRTEYTEGGGSYEVTDQFAVRQATDYMDRGRLRPATAIEKATGVFSNDDAVIQGALRDMSKEDQDRYFDGRALAQQGIPREQMTDKQREALDMYNEMQTAMRGLHWFGKDRKTFGYEAQVGQRGGEGTDLTGKLVEIGGHWTNDHQENLSAIENMSRASFDRLMEGARHDAHFERDGQKYRSEFQADVLKGMQLNLGSGDYLRDATDLLNRKVERAMNINRAADANNLEELKRLNPELKDEAKLKEFLAGREVARQLEQMKGETPSQTRQMREEFLKNLGEQGDKAYNAYRDSLYRASQDERRPLLDTLKHNAGTFSTDRMKMWEAVKNMSSQDRADLAKNETAIRAEIEKHFGKDSPARAAIDRLFEQIKADPSKPPEASIVDELNVRAGLQPGSRADNVRYIADNLRNDPNLRGKLATDSAFRAEFEKAATAAVGGGKDGYERFVAGLVDPKKGGLSADALRELNTTTVSDGEGGSHEVFDQKGYFKDAVLNASPEALQRLKSNSEERAAILANISDPKLKQLAESVINDGKLSPEAQVRAFVLDAGVSKDELRGVLASLGNDEAQRNIVANNYRDKFSGIGGDHGNLTADVLKKVDPGERHEFLRLTRRDEWSESLTTTMAADSVGRANTGMVTGIARGYNISHEEALAGLYRAQFDAQIAGRDLTPAEMDRHWAAVDAAVKSFHTTKESTSETIVNGAIMAGAIAAAPFTGGTSMAALLATGGVVAVGGATGAGLKYALMGDTHRGGEQLISDFAKYSIITAANLLGPEHLAASLRLGARAGTRAAETALADAAFAGMAKEVREAVTSATAKLYRDGLTHGGGVTNQAVEGMVAQLAQSGQLGMLSAEGQKLLAANLIKAGPGAVADVARSTLTQVANAARETVVNRGTAMTLGTTANVLGNVGSSLAVAGIEGRAYTGEQFKNDIIMGVGMGLPMVGGMQLLGASANLARKFRSLDAPTVHGSAPDIVRVSDTSTIPAGEPRIVNSGTTTIKDSPVVAHGDANVTLQGRSDGAFTGNATGTLQDLSVARVSDGASVTARDRSVVQVDAGVPGQRPKVELRDQASADVRGPAQVTANGAGTVAVAHSGARNVDLTLNDGVGVFDNASGTVRGQGALEVSGKSNVTVEVPAGQTMTVTVRSSDAQVNLSPDSKGTLKVVLEDGAGLPPGLKDNPNVKVEARAAAPDRIARAADTADGAPSPVDDLVRRYNAGDRTVTRAQVQDALIAQARADLRKMGIKDADGLVDARNLRLERMESDSRGGYDPRTDQIGVVTNAGDNLPSKTLAHELRHRKNTFDRTALQMADPEGFRASLVDDVLSNTGQGGKRVIEIPEKRTLGIITRERQVKLEDRLLATPDETQFMRDTLRRYLNDQPGGKMGPTLSDASQLQAWMQKNKIEMPPGTPYRQQQIMREMVGEISHANYVMRTSVISDAAIKANPNLARALDDQAARLRQITPEGRQRQMDNLVHNRSNDTNALAGDVARDYYRFSTEEIRARRTELSANLRQAHEDLRGLVRDGQPSTRALLDRTASGKETLNMHQLREHLPELRGADPARAAKIEAKLAEMDRYIGQIQFNNSMERLNRHVRELRTNDSPAARAKVDDSVREVLARSPQEHVSTVAYHLQQRGLASGEDIMRVTPPHLAGDVANGLRLANRDEFTSQRLVSMAAPDQVHSVASRLLEQQAITVTDLMDSAQGPKLAAATAAVMSSANPPVALANLAELMNNKGRLSEFINSGIEGGAFSRSQVEAALAQHGPNTRHGKAIQEVLAARPAGDDPPVRDWSTPPSSRDSLTSGRVTGDRFASTTFGADAQHSLAVDGKGYKIYSLSEGNSDIVIPIKDNKFTLGRADDAAFQVSGHDGVSRYHAQVEFTPSGPTIKDLNSTNGTYVNGQRVPTEGTVLRPGDKIRLAKDGPEFTFGETYRPDAFRQHALEINGQNVPIDKQKIALGRSSDTDVVLNGEGVSRRHAEIEFTADGPILRDLGSKNGTYVNGEKIDGPVKLEPGDVVRLGRENDVFTFKDNKFMRGDGSAPREVNFYRAGDNDVVARRHSVSQSNNYKDTWEMREPVQDGFQMLGGESRIRHDGHWHDPHRPATVVDRTQDTVLNETIREAHMRFDKINERIQQATTTAQREALQIELATELAKFSKDKMHPAGWTEGSVDAAYFSFRAQNANKQVLLGDYIDQAARGQGAGVCQHQALLFKVLADDFGLDAALVAGHSGPRGKEPFPRGHSPNHAWNEVHIGGKRLVFDPRQEVHGQPYRELAMHTPGRDFTGQPKNFKPEDVKLQSGQQVYHDNSVWKVEGFNTRNGDVILSHPAQRPVTVQEFQQANPGRQLSIGETYKVQRSSGAVEGGWRYDGVNNDGTLRFYKEDGLKIEVKRTQVGNENPHLVRGRDGEIMMSPPDINKVLDDPKATTDEFLDAAEMAILTDGAVDPARMLERMQARLAADPALSNSKNFARTLDIVDAMQEGAGKQALLEDMVRRMPLESMNDTSVYNKLLGRYYDTPSSQSGLRQALADRLNTALKDARLDDFDTFNRMAAAFELKAGEQLGDNLLLAMRRISADEKRMTGAQLNALKKFQKDNGNAQSGNMLGLYERAMAAYDQAPGPWWSQPSKKDWRVFAPIEQVKNPDGTVTFKSPHGDTARFTYDEFGEPVKIVETHPGNKTMEYTRGEDGVWRDAQGTETALDVEKYNKSLPDEQLDKLWSVLEARAKYNDSRVPESDWNAWLNEFGLESKRGGKEYQLHWAGTTDKVKYADGSIAGHAGFHGRNVQLNQVYAYNMFDGLISLGVRGQLR